MAAFSLGVTANAAFLLSRVRESKKFCRALAIETAEWGGDPCQAQGWKRKLEDGKRRAPKGWRGKVRKTSHFCVRFGG